MDLKRRLLYALVLLFFTVSLSVAGYRLLGGPGVSLLQALYMAVITLAGVGYGEIVDTSHNPALRVFNMFVVLFGVTITVYVFSSFTAFLVEGEITDIFRRRSMLKRINELTGHYVVCGVGTTGRYAIEELRNTGHHFVVIDHHEENIKRLLEHAPHLKDILYLIGDATDEDTLEQAGIDRASGLLAMLPEDKENLVVTVVARQKSPNLRIVARCSDPRFAERIARAGATSTVSPNQIGGMRLASEMLRPHAVGFLDLMLKSKEGTLRIEEIAIPDGCPWVGRAIQELNFAGRYNLMLLAIKTDAGAAQDPALILNPPPSRTLREHEILILMGDVRDIHRARRDALFTARASAARH